MNVFISEIGSFPFDEGAKNIVFNLTRQSEFRKHFAFVTNINNDVSGVDATRVPLNKFFLSRSLTRFLRLSNPDAIMYAPAPSATLNSFIRAKMLKLICKNAKIIMLALQHREHHPFCRYLIGRLKPDALLLLSTSEKEYFNAMGLKGHVLAPAVDTGKFTPVESSEKKRILRNKYGLLPDTLIVLHVGHISTNRNLEWLIQLQRLPQVQVVLVNSTSTRKEKALKTRLEQAGIRVIDNYLADIQEIYQVSDLYVFPVLARTGALEMPLSVLEALACNLYVITTRFGGLTDYFSQDRAFRYIEDLPDLLAQVRAFTAGTWENHKKVQSFTWENFAKSIIPSTVTA